MRLKTDYQFWAQEMNAKSLGGFEVPWPPYGFNSYMEQEDVSRAEAERLGLLKKGDRSKLGPAFDKGGQEMNHPDPTRKPDTETRQAPSLNTGMEASLRKARP